MFGVRGVAVKEAGGYGEGGVDAVAVMVDPDPLGGEGEGLSIGVEKDGEDEEGNVGHCAWREEVKTLK